LLAYKAKAPALNRAQLPLCPNPWVGIHISWTKFETRHLKFKDPIFNALLNKSSYYLSIYTVQTGLKDLDESTENLFFVGFGWKLQNPIKIKDIAICLLFVDSKKFAL
jgi:hypothetical protein